MHISTSHDICGELIAQAYSLTRAGELSLSAEAARAWEALRRDYETLPLDEYLPGGAKYRFRRYGRAYFQPETGELIQLPHQDFYQPVEHNKVTGGIVRKFAPLLPESFNNLFMQELIRFNFSNFPLSEEQYVNPWVVAIHEIRVLAEGDGFGEPTPEGIHRDGAEFVTVHLAEFENAGGGEVTIYDNNEHRWRSSP